MPSAELSALVDLAGGQVPTDLAYVDDVSAGAAGSKSSTLNDLFAVITRNITDLSLGFQDGATATVSALSQGKIRYNNAAGVFQISVNTAGYDSLASLAANQTWSGTQTYGSAPVDQVGIPMSAARRIRLSDGTDVAPLDSQNPSISVQRYDANTDATIGTIAYTFSLTRKTGALRDSSYNVYARSVSEDGTVAHEVACYYAAGGGTGTSIGSIKGIISDITSPSTNTPLALCLEIDPVNATGATNGALTASIPAGSAIGIAIAPGTSGAGSTNVTAGIVFQNGGSSGGAGTPAIRTGIHFDTTSIASAGYAIDFKFLTQGSPIRFANNQLGLVGRNAADGADVDLLKINSSNNLMMMAVSGGNVHIGPVPSGTVRSLNINNTSTLAGVRIKSPSADFLMYSGAASTGYGIFDETAGADRFIINSDGEVGINNTSPASQFRVVSRSATVVGQIVDSAASPTAAIAQFRVNGSATDLFAILQDAFFTYPGYKRTTADFSKTSDTTLANITGLSVNVRSGRTYAVKVKGIYTADVAGGVKFAIAGTATASFVNLEGYMVDNGGNALASAVRITALGTAHTFTGITEGYEILEGVITASASGTLTVQFAQNVSNATPSTVLQGATWEVVDIT